MCSPVKVLARIKPEKRNVSRRERGNSHVLHADTTYPPMKHPGSVKRQQAELSAGGSCFFAVQHEPAFHINPTLLFPPAQRALWVGEGEKFRFSEAETVK